MKFLAVMCFFSIFSFVAIVCIYWFIGKAILKAYKDRQGSIGDLAQSRMYDRTPRSYVPLNPTPVKTNYKFDEPKPRRWEANLNRATTIDEIYDQYQNIQPGRYYNLEIVRPEGRFNDPYYRDDMRNVNGKMRVVSKQRMYVSDVRKGDDKIEFDCRGYDNRCRRDNRTYTFYQTPDAQNQRDEYILNIEED